MHGFGWGWPIGGMWLSGLLIVIVLVLGIWWAAGGANRRAAGVRDPAEEALRARYARGEIDREEYQRRLSDLRS